MNTHVINSKMLLSIMNIDSQFLNVPFNNEYSCD